MGQNGAPDTVLIGIVVTISSMLGLFAINKVVKYVKVSSKNSPFGQGQITISIIGDSHFNTRNK